jgi:hypothetical protein
MRRLAVVIEPKAQPAPQERNRLERWSQLGEAENLILRHQLNVMRRQWPKRGRFPHFIAIQLKATLTDARSAVSPSLIEHLVGVGRVCQFDVEQFPPSGFQHDQPCQLCKSPFAFPGSDAALACGSRSYLIAGEIQTCVREELFFNVVQETGRRLVLLHSIESCGNISGSMDGNLNHNFLSFAAIEAERNWYWLSVRGKDVDLAEKQISGRRIHIFPRGRYNSEPAFACIANGNRPAHSQCCASQKGIALTCRMSVNNRDILHVPLGGLAREEGRRSRDRCRRCAEAGDYPAVDASSFVLLFVV